MAGEAKRRAAYRDLMAKISMETAMLNRKQMIADTNANEIALAKAKRSEAAKRAAATRKRNQALAKPIQHLSDAEIMTVAVCG